MSEIAIRSFFVVKDTPNMEQVQPHPAGISNKMKDLRTSVEEGGVLERTTITYADLKDWVADVIVQHSWDSDDEPHSDDGMGGWVPDDKPGDACRGLVVDGASPVVEVINGQSFRFVVYAEKA